MFVKDEVGSTPFIELDGFRLSACGNIIVISFVFVSVDLFRIVINGIMGILAHSGARSDYRDTCAHTGYTASGNRRIGSDDIPFILRLYRHVACLHRIAGTHNRGDIAEAHAYKYGCTHAGGSRNGQSRYNGNQLVAVFCKNSEIALSKDADIASGLRARVQFCDDHIDGSAHAGRTAAGGAGCIGGNQFLRAGKQCHIATDSAALCTDGGVIQDLSLSRALEIGDHSDR